MAKKHNPKKAEQDEIIMSIDELKEMKSHVLSIPMKLQNSRFDDVPNIYTENQAIIDRFYRANKHRMTPQQCEMARHDFEYFKFLLNLAIHYSEKGDHRREL